MSKRSERREADRLARKAAYLKSREPRVAAEPLPELTGLTAAEPEAELLARAQAFFDRSELKPPSAARVSANQANSQLSTGPRTPEGKSVSSRNNTRHGLASAPDGENFQVLATENQHEYNESLASYRREWKPSTATEHDLVNRLAIHRWLRLRARRLQENLFDDQTGGITDVGQFQLYRRYENQHDRAYNKAFSDLMRLRAFQLRQQTGFESQRRKNEEHEIKLRRLKRQEEMQIVKLSIAETRLKRLVPPVRSEIEHKTAA